MGYVYSRQVYVLMNKNLWLLILSQIFAFTAAPVTVFLSGIIGSKFSPIKSLATLPTALSIVGIAIFAIFAAKRVKEYLGIPVSTENGDFDYERAKKERF